MPAPVRCPTLARCRSDRRADDITSGLPLDRQQPDRGWLGGVYPVVDFRDRGVPVCVDWAVRRHPRITFGPPLALGRSPGYPPRPERQAIRLENHLAVRGAVPGMTATISRPSAPSRRKRGVTHSPPFVAWRPRMSRPNSRSALCRLGIALVAARGCCCPVMSTATRWVHHVQPERGTRLNQGVWMSVGAQIRGLSQRDRRATTPSSPMRTRTDRSRQGFRRACIAWADEWGSCMRSGCSAMTPI